MTKAAARLPATDAEPTHNAPWDVVALYAFTPIDDRDALRDVVKALGTAHGLCGTLLIAHEGFNGTLAGPKAGLDAVVALLEACLAEDRRTEIKFSQASAKPFGKLKIRLKKEIVTLGVEGVDPHRMVGAYVKPEDWNALISDPDTVVVDTRNDYEIAIGTFDRSVDPGTRVFREFPAWVADNRASLEGKRIAMFCTGGIRCEKATALMKAEGFDDVHHLEGGILRYLETVPPEQSLWRGECFVFDERVALAHGLAEGDSVMCPQCGTPIAASALDATAERCPDCARAPLREARQTPLNRR
jgi:UPF0176 protein